MKPESPATYPTYLWKFLVDEVCEDLLHSLYESAINEYSHIINTDHKRNKIFNFILRCCKNSKKSLNKGIHEFLNESDIDIFAEEIIVEKSSTYIF